MKLEDSVKRFTNRVENYVKYRPHYPSEVITYLKDNFGLKNSDVIADIGSGPGISSEHFLSNGNKVYGVEPNDLMREAAEMNFADNDNFISIKGTAEDTTLKDASVDMVIAGQAFHWFNKSKCKIEFKRILKQNGHVVLMWNEKLNTEGLMNSYYSLLDKYGTDYQMVRHEDVDDDAIAKFFSPSPMNKVTFVHYHELDYDGLEGRLLSSSYIPLEGEVFKKMINELKEIFEKHSVDGKVKMAYETNVYCGTLG